MSELFGVSMTLIMYVLLALLGVSLASVAYVGLRNRVMFKLGVRNIPRRTAQTVLIVVGLMLSTIIIAAAFTTGDTVDRSITGQIYSVLGSLDEVVLARDADDEELFGDPEDTQSRVESFSATGVGPLVSALESNPLIDAVIPAYGDVAVAVNLERRLSAPTFHLLGLDVERAGDISDIEALGGGRLSVADLGPGEIYVNESAADELNVGAGDSIALIARGETTDFEVRAVVKDRVLAGANGISLRREGGVVPLAAAQEIFGAPGQLTQIAISNLGDTRGGLKHSAAVEAELSALLSRITGTAEVPALFVQPLKRDGVDIAEAGANIFTTFFLVLGLFSIGAGILLIFMIFVMLAAERKPEMGMARAVGTKRADLVQTFLAEGMAYNVVAAMVGTGLGVLVAVGMSRIMAAIFSEFDINISPHVTLRSLLISYSLGVVLTFATVTFSSWRVSQINIVRAIRDIPEPPTPKPVWRGHSFFATLRSLVFKESNGKAWRLRGGLILLGFVVQMGAGATDSGGLQLLFGTIGFLIIVLAVFLTFRAGFLFIIVGAFSLALGASESSAFLVLAGLSLLPLGLALVLRSFGANERLTFTAAGLIMLYVWLFDFSVGLIERVFGELDGDIEMFFLSGVMITVAATFVVVYNSDMILSVLTRFGRGLGALAPSIKMAVAYPLANKMRTGLTMAMFTLVVFALTVMSSMNHNFNELFLSDRALGGWDITVDENRTNPIGDLEAALAAVDSPATAAIEAVGVVDMVGDFRARLCQPEFSASRCALDSGNFDDYQVRGVDAGFFEGSTIPLQTRARAYASDEAAWRAVASDPSLAIIDAFSLGGGFGGGGSFALQGVDDVAKDIDPVDLVFADLDARRSQVVQVIGVIERGASATYTGLHVRQPALAAVYGEPDGRRFFVRTVAGVDNRETAREIESALLTTGAQAESLRQRVDEQNATFEGFFFLMQGFMGLGLLVGVAAVGVIAFRTVVERRQQIGMLRALGYTRSMIGMTFLIESAFIAFMGVLTGIVFALILARQLITEQFANQGATSFLVPWEQILVIGGLAFGFALLMTVIPSRQAASIPIAQALRYE